MLLAVPQTLRGLLWAVAAAEAQGSMTEEVKARLSEFALQGVHTCTPRALEVMVWATKRSLLDMQDVYHACLAAVCAPSLPRMSNVRPFCMAQAQLVTRVRLHAERAGDGSGGQRALLLRHAGRLPRLYGSNVFPPPGAGRMPAWQQRACTLVFTVQHWDTSSPIFLVVRNWSGPNT